ncbi:hypothetical protein NP233_g6543 [Leucocoprinus birnbaumii]|uniref:Uncharacterized protein n=1 Tax=Leucocoprinus birnbaumii TaxID=56174 RepID=A0AAD5YTK8_9AGAR|nr:hypothetical protein NP233_g6543 [Leucocoprinus birnbaumii]
MSSAPRIAGSQSEGHVRDNASHYVPPRTKFGEMNTGYGTSNGNGSALGSGSNGSKCSKPLSRTYSEPNQQTYNSSSAREGYSSSGGATSVSGARVGAKASMSPVPARNAGVRVVLIESPSWLGSYPSDDDSDDDSDGVSVFPLSPITSPAISSRLLGPSRSEPASTFAASMGLAADRLASDDGSENFVHFRSPKPEKPATLIPFSPAHSSELSGGRSNGNSENRNGKPRQRQTPVSSPRRNLYNSTQQPPVAGPSESFVDLVEKVSQLVEDLRVQIISPPTQTDAVRLHDEDLRKQKLLSKSKRSLSPRTAVGGPNEMMNITSPRSNLQRQLQSPGASAGVPANSVLFSQGTSLATPRNNSSNAISSPCKHCRGTGQPGFRAAIAEYLA